MSEISLESLEELLTGAEDNFIDLFWSIWSGCGGY